MGKITAVLFDMYETLAQNDTGMWIDTFGEICQAQALDVEPGLLYQEWKNIEMVFRRDRLNLEEPDKSPPFKSYEEAWRDSFFQVFHRLGLEGDAAAASKDAILHMGRRDPFQDAIDTLPIIQARWKTAVLSNADDGYLFPLIDRVGWKFDAVLSSEGARAYKPLPSPFRQIMGQLGIGPDEAMYVGDTLYDDILGAKGVGMRATWINRHRATPDPRFPKPDYEVISLTELPEILRALS